MNLIQLGNEVFPAIANQPVEDGVAAAATDGATLGDFECGESDDGVAAEGDLFRDRETASPERMHDFISIA